MGWMRSLYRRFRLGWHRPRHWQLRPGTFDRRAFRDVVLGNEYRLPARFAPTDVVLDVGAHIGTFALAALRRGAGCVWCCEPDADNFRVLEHNLAPYRNRVRLLRCAVWRSDAPAETLALHNPRDAGNTGGVQVSGGGTVVAALAFDELAAWAAPDNGRIRLVKLDCEGAEWPILLTSTVLDRIDALCGEYHVEAFPDVFQTPGWPEFTPAVLHERLRQEGFSVHLRPHPQACQPVLGNFFAWRGDDFFS